jgi:hypothetical protein
MLAGAGDRQAVQTLTIVLHGIHMQVRATDLQCCAARPAVGEQCCSLHMPLKHRALVLLRRGA